MPWDIVYYKAPDGSVPAIEFVDGCPTKVAAHLLVVLDAVAEAPPPQYSGGGKWEATHGTMGGYYEVRASGRVANSSGCSVFSRTLTGPSSVGAGCPGRRLQC